MTKKPIKRNEHIVPLSREHHFSLLFAWKIKTGLKWDVDLDRIRKYIAHFWEHNLSIHFMEEETTLFAIHQDELVEKALQEHTQMRAEIKLLETLKDQETIKAQIMNIADLVTAHVRFEERELFPHLEQVLTPEQLRKVGHDLLEIQPEPLQDNYSDEFWMKKN